MIKIYFSFIVDYDCDKKLIESLGESRSEYVNTITDKHRRAQSVYVWKLLKFALSRDFPFVNQKFILKDDIWNLIDNSVFFSLAHSNNAVAVAISDRAVGVDVEICSDKILKVKKLFSKIEERDDITLSLTKAWTEKESLYKCKSGNKFFSKIISDKEYNDYVLTACGLENEVVFEHIDFSILNN